MLFRPSNRHIRQHIALNETGTLGLVRKVSDEDRHIWVKKKVLINSLTLFEMINMVIYADYQPVFIDNKKIY